MKPARDDAAAFPSLDGLRGLAVLSVMAYHFSVGAVPQQALDRIVLGALSSGWVGVDLFFVLSGFLITGILLGTARAPERFRNFYARRALRIFPAYYGLLLFFIFVAPLVHRGVAAAQIAAPLRAHALPLFTYTINLVIAWQGSWASSIPYFSPHFWSLAIEEQFYLFWPWLTLGREPRTVLRTCAVVIVGSIALRVVLVLAGASPISTYTFTLSRLDGLALGGMVASAMRIEGMAASASRWRPAAIMVAAGVVAAGFARDGRLDPYAPWTLGAVIGALGVLFAFSVSRAVERDAAARSSLLTLPPLRFAGRYSYGLYILHFPVIHLLSRAHIGVDRFGTIAGSALPGVALFTLLAGSITLAAALVSWYALEAPFLRLKRFVPR